MVAGVPSLFRKRQWVPTLAAVVTGVASAAVLPLSAAAAPGAPADLDPIASDGSVRLTSDDFDADADARDDSVGGLRITGSTAAFHSAKEASAMLTRLRNGVPVGFRVAAVLRSGVGPASAPSQRMTPLSHTPVGDWRAGRPLQLAGFTAAAVPLEVQHVFLR